MEIIYHSKYKFYATAPWIMGSIIYFLSLLFKHSFYYIYLYFYFVGLFVLLLSRIKFAYFDKNEITFLNYSFFNKLPITLKWSEILEAKYHRYQKTVTLGGVGSPYIPLTDTVEKNGILLHLTDQISDSIRNIIEKQNRQLWQSGGLSVEKGGIELLISEIPSIDFSQVLKAFEQHALVTVSNKNTHSHSKKLKQLLFYMSLLVATVAFLMFIRQYIVIH